MATHDPERAGQSAARCPSESDLPLVSVIVPTRNSATFLERCLDSIRNQTYPRLELVVVDNHSTDETIEIAGRYADTVLTAGPERSAQLNAGVERSSGTYVYRVDSDFEVDATVVMECVAQVAAGVDAVVVHNTADATQGWLARVRKFEVDMYKYSLDHTSPRFLSRELFHRVGGLREDVTAGEDYDFSNRLRRLGARIGFVDAEAIHLDEPKNLLVLLKKYYAYGHDFPNYRRYNRLDSRRQLSFVRRDYLRHWRRFAAHPLLGAGFALYHSAKFAAGSLGYATAVLGSSRSHLTERLFGQRPRSSAP